MPAQTPSPPRTGRPRKRDEPLGITAAELTLNVIDALARADGPLSLKALSVATGLDQSKLHRYLVSLCARGFARRSDNAGLYTLGPAALSLGVRALNRHDEVGVLRDAVGALGSELEATSFLYIWTRAGPVLIHNHVPPTALINIRLGSIVPFLSSASGPVFLAFVAEELTGPLLAHELLENPGAPGDTASRLYEQICPIIRRDRVYWTDTTFVPLSEACAAPVVDASGNLVGVIGASLLRRQLAETGRSGFVELVRQTAIAASADLGFEAR